MSFRYKYEELVEGLNQSVFNNDVRFLKERYDAERQSHQHRIQVLLLVFSTIILFALILAVINYYKRKEEKYERSLLDAKLQYDLINRIIGQNGQSQAVENTLIERKQTLQSYIDSNIRNDKTVFDKRETGEILESIGLMCALAHPRFVETLTNHGLTLEEVGICTMYVYQYQPKQMSSLIGASSLYHKNMAIRKKLSFTEERTTLKTQLKKVLEETEDR